MFLASPGSSCCSDRKRSTLLVVVLIGDEVGYILVEEKLYRTAKFLDGSFDLRRHLMPLDIQVEPMINQRFGSFHQFHFVGAR